MKHKKILITGTAGQLGREFRRILSQRGMNFTAPTEDLCNITNFEQVEKTIDSEKPDIIINCAAYNLVDETEENPKTAFLVNSVAVENLAKVCKQKNIFLVHYSSDYVFDGEKGSPYTEEDSPAPISIYGQTKLEGELAVQRILTDYLVLRTSWVFGVGTQNFLYKLKQWATNNTVVKVSSDETSVPTYAVDIVNITLLSLEKGLKGLYHLTNSGYTSRYELSKYFTKKIGLETKIEPVPASSFNTKARRPRFSAMSNGKILKELRIPSRSWEDSIDRFVKEKYKER